MNWHQKQQMNRKNILQDHKEKKNKQNNCNKRGGCYAPLLTVIVLDKLCNVKLPRLLITIMTVYSTLVICLVMTIGKCGIYYKHMEIGYGNGYNYLIKTYGPLHVLYPIMMIIYAIIMFIYVIYALKQRKQISFRAVFAISITAFSVMFMYILESK